MATSTATPRRRRPGTVTALASSGPPSTAPDGDAPLGVVVVSYGSPDLLRRNLAPPASPATTCASSSSTTSPPTPTGGRSRSSARRTAGTSSPCRTTAGSARRATPGIAAARELGCRTFLFLNPDALITRDVVAELRAHSLREPLSLISPQLVSSTGEVVFRAARTDLRDGRVRRRPEADGLRTDDPGDWLCGACVVVHEELLARIGGFDENYFLYWEDVDLGFRAVAAGGDGRAARGPRRGARRGRYPRPPPGPGQVRPLLPVQLPQPAGLRGAEPRPAGSCCAGSWPPGGQLGDPAARRPPPAAADARRCSARPRGRARRAGGGAAGAPPRPAPAPGAALGPRRAPRGGAVRLGPGAARVGRRARPGRAR